MYFLSFKVSIIFLLSKIDFIINARALLAIQTPFTGEVLSSVFVQALHFT
uniref:Uncharacterized protein n=1 Tax=Bacteriophage sp. TaxID=38018 RepID=A0A8D9PEJ7_9VIRU|nr:MAG TPA: hypothetical protein [Bacteriophage sp.]